MELAFTEEENLIYSIARNITFAHLKNHYGKLISKVCSPQ